MFGFIGVDSLCLWICYLWRPDLNKCFCLQSLSKDHCDPLLFSVLERSYFTCGSKINSYVNQNLDQASMNCRGTMSTRLCSFMSFVLCWDGIYTLYLLSLSFTFPGFASSSSFKIYTPGWPPVDTKLKTEISQSSMCCRVHISYN